MHVQSAIREMKKAIFPFGLTAILLFIGAPFLIAATQGSSQPIRRNTFRPAASYPTGGSGAWFIRPADLGSDGILDLLIVNKESTSITTLAGSSDGTFQPATQRPTIPDPRRVVVANLNQDAAPDLVVIGYFANGFSVALSNGGGGYHSDVFYGLEGHGKMLAVGDVNNDGRQDVIATSDGSGQPISVSIFLGDGDGDLKLAGYRRTAFYSARDIEVVDIDGDAKLDVLLSTTDPAGQLLIFKGLGDGSVDAPAALPTLAKPPALNDGSDKLVCADVNGDDRPDLVVAHNEEEFEAVSIRLSREDGTFAPALILPTPFPTDVAVGDLDHDGRPDLAAANYSTGTLTLFLNRGGNQWQLAETIPVGAQPRSLALADYNRDGWADLAVVNGGENRVSILLNQARMRRPFPTRIP